MLVLFPRRKVERERLVLGLAPFGPNTLVRLLDIILRDVIVRLELGVAAVDDSYELHNMTVNDLTVRRFNEAELVDAREARERRDKSDVRPLRRLNRADATVVRRVNVAHLKPCALAR